MIMTITGTNHFVSFERAVLYYKEYGYSKSDVRLKVNTGEICIGAPRLNEGERLVFLDCACRYGIERTEP